MKKKKIQENTDSIASDAELSSSGAKAKRKAHEYAKDPEKLYKLIDDATQKASNAKNPLQEVFSQLHVCLRLIKAYAKGSYRKIPWHSFTMIVASVIYFVMPVDLIPDWIAGLGFLDDAALIGFTVKTLNSDLAQFALWEAKNQLDNGDVSD